MPCTTTRLDSVKKIAICASSGLCGQLGGAIRCAVHGVDHCHQWVVRLGEDPASFGDVVAVQPDHQWLVRLVAEQFEGLHDPVRDRVAGGDPAEHVHEHA